MDLESSIQGEEVKTDYGTFCMINFSLNDFPSKLRDMLSQKIPYVVPESLAAAFPGFPSFNRTPPEKILYTDIENCGLHAKSTIYLVSYGTFSPKGSQIISLFARDYGEERPMLAYFLNMLHENTAIATFNGRSFDLDRVGKRARHQGLEVNGFRNRELTEVLGDRHVDLRHDCRDDLKKYAHGPLQQIEKLRHGYLRHGDISGKLAPKIYQDYVEGRCDERLAEEKMVEIIRHNAIDVAATFMVAAEVCSRALNDHQKIAA